MKRVISCIIIVLSLLFSGNNQTYAQVDEGASAFYKGEYAKALGILEPLADGGNYGAQYYLGEMYLKGVGVSQDAKKAAELFLKAAKGNYPFPQYRLGELYRDGRGVAQNNKAAYMWFALAAAYGHNDGALGDRDRIAEKLTSPEIEEAKKNMVDWIDNLLPEKRP
jgi:uncharacterized protein